ncbi:MAG: L-aspartate oxidase [Planctomycetota bacterium]
MTSPYLERRYLVGFETRRLPHIFTDVLVIGAGAAGLRAAIEVAEGGAEVIVVTKDELAETNTYYAQGGIAAVVTDEDTLEEHIADTLTAACGLADEQVVREVISAAPEHIRELSDWGVPFDRGNGELLLGREGGHGKNRIIHAAGDATGKAMAEVLVAKARESDATKLWDQCFVLDLLTDPPGGGGESECVGAITWHPRYGMQTIQARRTILAAGGAGMLWRETTNPAVATTDAIAMAFRAGATVADVEMMQFHPTTLYVAGATRSLVTEAVRGEGALLVDRKGYRFMGDYDERGELAPRDVVSRAIMQQMAKTESTHVYLDARRIGRERFAERFPGIFKQCESFGIDPGSDLIPVHPAAHYMIGGARVDGGGRTTLPGLLACGEASCTGLHGANRLASNSLSEALVYGKRCGQTALSDLDEVNDRLAATSVRWSNQPSRRTELDLADVRNSLRSLMWRNTGIVRQGDRLAETLEIVNFWGRYVLDKEFYDDPSGWEAQNMLTTAYILTECAIRRTETRGVHYRRDFPATDPAWARHQQVRRTEYQLVVE